MQPRRPTSKKWTHFPKEFTDQIEEVFLANFQKQLVDAKLIVEGRIFPEELMLRVGFLEKGRLKQENFEVSADYQPNEPEALDRIHHLVDVAASLMADFFDTEGAIELPYLWKEIKFKGQPLFVQYNSENSELEAQADALLGLDPEHLINESEVSDALDVAEKNQLH